MKNKRAMLFCDINPVPTQYPWLSFNEECEVLVIGGGVSGCMTAYSLSKSGVDTLLISKKPIGFSNCSIDSSTLNFQNELMLTSLVEDIGRDKALKYFAECSSAFEYIKELSQKLSFDFKERDSFLYTNAAEKVNDLHTEYLIRKHNGFDVEFLEKSQAGEHYSFEVKAGILSKGGGGELDCYKLCHSLAKACEEHGARIYENTCGCDIVATEDGFAVYTDNMKKISTKKIVFATGFRQDEYLKRLTGKRRSYFLATAPVESFSGIESRELIKDIDKNINLRTTADDRIIISGLDNATIDKNGKIGKLISVEKLLSRKYSDLNSILQKMLCGIGEITSDYEYSGIYGTTKDSLPIIGEHKDYKNTFFNLSSSINGAIHSVIGAKIITKCILGECPENIFSPNRSSL